MSKWFALMVVFVLAGCGSSSVAAAPHVPAASATPTKPPPQPRSWLTRSTLLTIYGRGFGIAPILGRLGFDANMNDLAAQAQPFIAGVQGSNGGKAVRLAIHLIYGLATPCSSGNNCLAYLDDAGTNIVQQYILPAQRRGWLVVLDDQLGQSSPVAEVQRMISKGYLRYDNVEIALDPEFRATPGQETPGIPVGSVNATEINQVENVLNAYCARLHLAHRKVLMVHQFQWFMILDRGSLEVNLPYIDPVIVADGFGPPDVKAQVYHDLLGAKASPRLTWRGIKLFYPNPYEQAGHGDYPVMTWQQVFGKAPVGPGPDYWISPAPNVVVIA